MNVFVATVRDRHCDPIVRVFSTRDRAIEWARREFRDCMACPLHIEEKQHHSRDFPLIWSARCTPESDTADVVQATVDEEV